MIARKRASRIETERRLLDAVGALLAESGFSAIGVNAIARRADVNKALIYRYFGGLEGLLAAYAEAGDFWPSIEEVLGDEQQLRALTPGERSSQMFRGYLHALRKRPRTIEILAWETVDRNELTVHLEIVRERWSDQLLQRLFSPEELQTFPQFLTIGAILSGGIHYLLIRARKIRLYGGIPLDTEEGWAALEDAVASIPLALERTRALEESDQR